MGVVALVGVHVEVDVGSPLAQIRVVAQPGRILEYPEVPARVGELQLPVGGILALARAIVGNRALVVLREALNRFDAFELHHEAVAVLLVGAHVAQLDVVLRERPETLAGVVHLGIGVVVLVVAAPCETQVDVLDLAHVELVRAVGLEADAVDTGLVNRGVGLGLVLLLDETVVRVGLEEVGLFLILVRCVEGVLLTGLQAREDLVIGEVVPVLAYLLHAVVPAVVVGGVVALVDVGGLLTVLGRAFDGDVEVIALGEDAHLLFRDDREVAYLLRDHLRLVDACVDGPLEHVGILRGGNRRSVVEFGELLLCDGGLRGGSGVGGRVDLDAQQRIREVLVGGVDDQSVGDQLLIAEPYGLRPREGDVTFELLEVDHLILFGRDERLDGHFRTGREVHRPGFGRSQTPLVRGGVDAPVEQGRFAGLIDILIEELLDVLQLQRVVAFRGGEAGNGGREVATVLVEYQVVAYSLADGLPFETNALEGVGVNQQHADFQIVFRSFQFLDAG